MSSEVAVTKQLVRAYLLEDAALRARVDGKVLSAHVESAEAQTMLQAKPLIVVELLSGFSRYFAALQDVTMEVYAYSKASQDEANDVYDAVYTRLQHECLMVANIDMQGVAREIERPLEGWNDDIRAWYARGRWTLKAVS